MISNVGKTIERDYNRFHERIANLERQVEEGKQKGKQEGQRATARQVAKKLLLKGMAIESIAEVTELSVDEIKEIENHMN